MSVPSDSRRDHLPGARVACRQTRARKLRVFLIGTVAGAAAGCWTAMLLLVFYTALADGETDGKAVGLVGFSGIALGALVGSVVGFARSRKVRPLEIHFGRLGGAHLPKRPPVRLPAPPVATGAARSRRPAPPPDSVAERLPSLLKG